MNMNIFMSTTVHIPEHLLEKVDARAKVLGISRNRLIVQTLESSLRSKTEWSPELLTMLRQPLDAESASLLDSTLAEAAQRRHSRKAPIEF